MSVQNFILWTAFVSVVGTDGMAATDVQIVLKQPASEKNRRAVYSVTSGNIDGLATVTSVTSASDAQTMVNAEIVNVKSTFDSSNAPYGGHITATIKCHTQKYVKEKEVIFEGEKTQAIVAVASNRRIFGICSADEVNFASGTWAAYDKNKNRVLTLKLFKPVSQASQIEKAQQDILQIFSKVITHL